MPVSGARTGAAGALAALLAGPPTGYTTSIPRGVSLVGVTTAEGTTTATFSQALGNPSRSAQGQIVATLARFPGVKHVFVAEQGRGRVVLHRGDGFALVSGARASDYVDLTPNAAIFVATPARDSTVSSPVKVFGHRRHLRGVVRASGRLGRDGRRDEDGQCHLRDGHPRYVVDERRPPAR